MRHETKHTIKKGVINAFGSFGYLFGSLQWFWATILYLSVIQSVTSFISSSSGKEVQPQHSDFTFTLPGPLGTIILAVLAVAMVIITLYALYAIPKNIVKASNKLVHKTANTVAPRVIRVQHKQDSKKIRMKIRTEIVMIIKFLLIIVPLFLTVMSKFIEQQPIDYSIAIMIGYWLASFSLVLFVIQYVLAACLRMKFSELW